MKISTNIDFFQKSITPATDQPVAESIKKETSPQEKSVRVFSSAEVLALMKRTTQALIKSGFPKMSARIDQIRHDVAQERFVISVVGEFNQGKSTFLNNLFSDAAMLPVGNLPTTAILTRIRYAHQPKMAVFDERGRNRGLLDIKPESWKGLVADNFGKEAPKGSVIIGIPDAWLGKYNLEVIDCPGAGDLSEERAMIIGDILNRTEGAIIALNATAALSLSEKLFIKNRILARKTPFTLIIVNKLDLVNKEERSKVLKYIKDVLELNKMDIPIYVPADIEMPDDTFADIIGIDKVKKAVEKWTVDPNRQVLKDAWIKMRVGEVIRTALDALTEQEKLLKMEEGKRKEVIAAKKLALDKLELEWNDLALKLQAKSNDCYKRFLDKVDEYSHDVVERLQYEAAHAGNPEKWWTEDYPYRLKVELANMSVGLENVITRVVAADARQFNELLNQKFRSVIQVGDITIADKNEYRGNQSEKVLIFEDLNKKQNYARVGTVVLSLALAPVFGLFATMGVGTAGTLLTSHIFKKKLEEQRTAVKEAIAKDIPAIILKATADSEKRIRAIYDDMLDDSEKKKETWREGQLVAIETENPSMAQHQLDSIAENRALLTDIYQKI